jgi:hypothetical protein
MTTIKSKGIPRITPEQEEFIAKNASLGPQRLSDELRPLTVYQIARVLKKVRAENKQVAAAS